MKDERETMTVMEKMKWQRLESSSFWVLRMMPELKEEEREKEKEEEDEELQIT